MEEGRKKKHVSEWISFATELVGGSWSNGRLHFQEFKGCTAMMVVT